MRKRSDSGFTLLEVLVVLAIIGTMAAVALPNVMEYLKVYRIRGASQQLAGAIQEARMKAITKSSNWGTVFVIQDARTYWVHLEDVQPPGVPADLRALIGGACTPGAGGALDRQCLDMGLATSVRTQSTRYVLPDRVMFANTAECTTTPPPAAPGFNPTDAQIRFSRLGSACDPTPATNCPPAGLAVGATTNLVDNRATDSMICLSLRDLAGAPTGIARWVTIARGGRVEEQR